ncbi:hypothetical protein TNCV_682481 [Trichonephila clavipes]|nr:hypothetical protein TNCV_682481 [Trichonephila clavipes]
MAKIGVNYEIITPEDGQYGIELSSGNWTGVIGMLYRGEAEIGISNLGIFEDRFRTVDFSSPYMSEGLYFSYVKSTKREQLFSFLRMFDFSTWVLFHASFFATFFSNTNHFKRPRNHFFYNAVSIWKLSGSNSDVSSENK